MPDNLKPRPSLGRLESPSTIGLIIVWRLGMRLGIQEPRPDCLDATAIYGLRLQTVWT
jgi:hypothetical protein